MLNQKIIKLNTFGEPLQQDTRQIVEVQFPSGGKNYSYVGSGNLRTGQTVDEAPVTHPKSGKNYLAKNVKVVATHNVVGAQVGDKLGVSGGIVKTIPTGLKYLPGNKEQKINPNINIRGENMSVADYLEPFKMKRLNTFGDDIGGNKNA